MFEKQCTKQHNEPVKDPSTCPSCRLGHVITRRGPYGEFAGCCRFPLCKFKCSIQDRDSMYDPDIDEPYFGM